MDFLKTALLATALAAASASAQAASYSFSCISTGAAAACADGAAKLTMDVSAGTAGSVDFTFKNFSSFGSSITEIYFDDGTLLGISLLADSGAGVVFSDIGSAAPGNLPGGSSVTPAFNVTAGFLVDTGNGGPNKGVENKLDGGVQEFVTINFRLINGKSFNDTIAALNGPLGDGNDLRVGLHVKSFGVSVGDTSASFISAVPEPTSLAMLVSGLGLLGIAVRRQKVRQG